MDLLVICSLQAISTNTHIEDQPDINHDDRWPQSDIMTCVVKGSLSIFSFSTGRKRFTLLFDYMYLQCLEYFPLTVYLALQTYETHQQTHICRIGHYKESLGFLNRENSSWESISQPSKRWATLPLPGSRGHPCILPYVWSFLIGCLTNGTRHPVPCVHACGDSPRSRCSSVHTCKQFLQPLPTLLW